LIELHAESVRLNSLAGRDHCLSIPKISLIAFIRDSNGNDTGTYAIFQVTGNFRNSSSKRWAMAFLTCALLAAARFQRATNYGIPYPGRRSLRSLALG